MREITNHESTVRSLLQAGRNNPHFFRGHSLPLPIFPASTPRWNTARRTPQSMQPDLKQTAPATIENAGEERRVVSSTATRLSRARKNVLELLLAGLPEKSIASRLRIIKTTVYNHVTSIDRIFGVHSRAELLALHMQTDARNGTMAYRDTAIC